MDRLMTEILIGMYVATNALRVLSYMPQIVNVAKDRSGAQVIALTTWSFWTVSNATTALYAMVVAHDLLLTLMSAANAFCCATVMTMVIAKRRRLNRGASCQRQRTAGCSVTRLGGPPTLVTADGVGAGRQSRQPRALARHPPFDFVPRLRAKLAYLRVQHRRRRQFEANPIRIEKVKADATTPVVRRIDSLRGYKPWQR